MKSRNNILLFALVLIVAMFASNCGQGSPGTATQSTGSKSVSIAISPELSAVADGKTEQFTVKVTGTTDTAVKWSISTSTENTGTINSNGLYTAPNAALPNAVTVTASSVADPSKVAYATTWVLAPGKVTSTNNPLVAQYSIWAPSGAEAKIEFGPDTSYGLDTWLRPAPSGGGTISIFVAGMRASSAYHMRAVVDMPDGAEFDDTDHTFQTGALPANRIPDISVTQPGNLTPSSGVELLDLINYQTPGNALEAVVTDLQGNVIWYYDVDPTGTTGDFPFPIKLMPNGNFLLNATPPGSGGEGGPGQLLEIDLAGDIVRSMTTAQLNSRLAAAGYNLTVNAMHHDFAILPNGHIILIVNHTKDYTDLPGYPGTTTVVGDALVELDQNWQPVWVWDSFDHLDINRHPIAFPDWTHANAVIYSPDDGDLLLSLRDQSWIIKIDYEDGKGTGNILWRFGYQGDFTLTSGGTPAAWPYGQHDINFVSANTSGIFSLAMFDNGWIRVMNDSGAQCGTTGEPACYSRGVIFQIDEATRTASVVWQDSNLPYSLALGSVRVQTNGDVEIDEGFLPDSPYRAIVQEVTPEMNPQVVWQLEEDHQPSYRIFRIPSLYPGVQW